MALPTLNDGFRVITQEESRLARTEVVLFDMDERHVQVAEPVIFERHVVPVYSGLAMVGSGHLFYRPNCVMATIVLDYFTPERFDLQIDTPVYATVDGTYYLRGNDLKMDYVDVGAIHLANHRGPNAFPVHLS
jgi:hypothetical protein